MDEDISRYANADGNVKKNAMSVMRNTLFF